MRILQASSFLEREKTGKKEHFFNQYMGKNGKKRRAKVECFKKKMGASKIFFFISLMEYLQGFYMFYNKFIHHKAKETSYIEIYGVYCNKLHT